MISTSKLTKESLRGEKKLSNHIVLNHSEFWNHSLVWRLWGGNNSGWVMKGSCLKWSRTVYQGMGERRGRCRGPGAAGGVHCSPPWQRSLGHPRKCWFYSQRGGGRAFSCTVWFLAEWCPSATNAWPKAGWASLHLLNGKAVQVWGLGNNLHFSLSQQGEEGQ